MDDSRFYAVGRNNMGDVVVTLRSTDGQVSLNLPGHAVRDLAERLQAAAPIDARGAGLTEAPKLTVPQSACKAPPDPLLTPYQNDLLSSFMTSAGQFEPNRSNAEGYLEWVVPRLRALNAQTRTLPDSE